MINLLISDLHLDEFHPRISELFLTFLKDKAIHADALYILGDFFEAWVGDDDLSLFNLSIIKGLHEATQLGLPIYFMQGNRDFLVGKKFMKMTGCQMLPDEHVILLAGNKVLLMHGDTLCTADLAYQKFRKKTHNWFIQKLFLMKKLSARKKIAADYRKKSQAYTSTAPEQIMDVTPADVMRVMQKHKVQHLIHGHTHRPAVHRFQLNGMPATRTVLAAWHDEGSVLVCDDDEMEVLRLPLEVYS
jgi:UDP-2,3-diacylglucosamine hydrolase